MLVDARTLTIQNWLQTRSQIGYTDIYMPGGSCQCLTRNGSTNEENMASKHCTNTIRIYDTSAIKCPQLTFLMHLICIQGALNANRKLNHSWAAWTIHLIHDWNRAVDAVAWWVESHGLSKEVFDTFRAFQTRSRVLAFFWLALCSPWFHVLTETAISSRVGRKPDETVHCKVTVFPLSPHLETEIATICWYNILNGHHVILRYEPVSNCRWDALSESSGARTRDQNSLRDFQCWRCGGCRKHCW